MLYSEIIDVCSQIHTKHINTLCGQNVEFLGAFAELRRVTISFVVSVCPLVLPLRTTPLPLYGFSWNFICEHFSKICRENSNFTKIWQEKQVLCVRTMYCTFMIISRWILLIIINVSDRICRENQNTHFMFGIFFFENPAVYEIMGKTWYSQTGHRWP